MRGAIMLNRYPLIIGIWFVLNFVGASPLSAAPRLDTTFGLNGRVAVELGARSSGHAVLVDPDGKIVIAGSSSKANALNFSLLRFHKNGSLDTSFNEDGSVITSLSIGDDEVLALGRLSDGRIIAAGYSHNGTDRDLAMVCYRQDGALDLNFGDRGVVLTSIGNGNEEITALTINSSDRITVVGSTEGTAGRVLVVARYFSNGEPDITFGEQGISLIGVGEDSSAEGILERKDGTFVISGSYEEKKKSSMMLVGLTGNGMVDVGFGEKGVAVPVGSFAASEGYGLTVDGDGMIYVAGSVGTPGKRDAALFRFTSNGKADAGFGDQGVAVTAISEEDDVLYGVDAGRNGVVASGFTTDAGTRQFLLNSYPPDDSAESVAGNGWSVSAGNANAAWEPAPIQEVRVNGNTRVQIRRLQVIDFPFINSVVRYSPELPLPGMPQFNSGFYPVNASADRLLATAGRRIGNFFLPAAHATAGIGAEAMGGTSEPRSITTTFSEGEAVSYAITSDEQGNIIVVGTAEGNAASLMVAARFVAEDQIDRITDKPGHRSSHIATVVPADVTRTTIATGGEIAASFGKEVVRRGVVFSVQPGPVYAGKVAAGASAVPSERMDILSSFFLPEAVAADSSTALLTSAATPTSGVPEQLIAVGETENGAGPGGYTALMHSLLPGTIYYIRAYALTATGEVYYGNQVSVRTADACFVATASFGTFLHPGVGILREFRDVFLVNHAAGKWLVDRYYVLSPPLADCIAGSSVLRPVVRALLLPLVGFSWLALQAGLGATLCGVLGVMVFFSWLVGRNRPRMNLPG
jgi:uncharacterized delta-60 repeat protein